MTDAISIYIPLINPNEPEALITNIFVKEGEQVSAGDLLFSLETTKSTHEVTADQSGYVHAIRFKTGELVQAGEIFCILADSIDWQPPKSIQPMIPSEEDLNIPDGMRITSPALALVKKHQFDIQELPQDTLITEEMVMNMLGGSVNVRYPSLASEFDPSAIIIYGGGGHGKSLIDLLRRLRKYHIAGIVDDGLQVGSEVMDIPILGGREVLSELYNQGIRTAANAVGGIGNISVRIEVFRNLTDAKFICPTLIHPRAFVEPSATLSSGIQIFPHAYLGSACQIGFGVIVNTSAVISHDCAIGDFTNVSPGAILAGQVKVGSGVLIGMGTTINLQVEIGDGARIGNGATVKADVPENSIVRAGSIWPE